MELSHFLFIVIVVLFILLVIANNRLKKCSKLTENNQKQSLDTGSAPDPNKEEK